jgi:Domain of unknown function (DUF4136)
LANNAIWANDVREAIRNDFRAHGLIEATNEAPDFYIAFYVGLKDRYDINSVGYGLPVFHRGFRTGWWGWPRGYDVWAVPYTESTVIVDVIDAHTNQLVWRGYDTNTLNTGEPGKTLTKRPRRRARERTRVAVPSYRLTAGLRPQASEAPAEPLITLTLSPEACPRLQAMRPVRRVWTADRECDRAR